MSEAHQQNQKDHPTPTWMSTNQGAVLLFAYFLLFLYVLPVYMIFIHGLLTSGFKDSGLLFELFAAFISKADATLSQYHKLLMPLLTGVSIFVMNGRISWGVLGLGVFLLVSWAVCLAAGVMFDIDSVKTALTGLKPSVSSETAVVFFARIQETLLSYFALLFGLKMAKGRF